MEDIRLKTEPFEFDGKRLRITRGEERFQLDQEVPVKVSAVDTDKRRIALELVTDTPEKSQADSTPEQAKDTAN